MEPRSSNRAAATRAHASRCLRAASRTRNVPISIELVKRRDCSRCISRRCACSQGTSQRWSGARMGGAREAEATRSRRRPRRRQASSTSRKAATVGAAAAAHQDRAPLRAWQWLPAGPRLRAKVFYVCPRPRDTSSRTGKARVPFHSVWFCGGFATESARRMAVRALRPARRSGSLEVFRSTAMLRKRGALEEERVVGSIQIG